MMTLKKCNERLITVSVAAFLALCTATVSAFTLAKSESVLSSRAIAEHYNSSVALLSSSSGLEASDIVTAEDIEKYAGRPETFEFEKKGYKSSYEQILAEDGFIFGMDYDWFPINTVSGYHLSDNHITGAKCVFNDYLVEMDIYNIAAMGYNALNIWCMTDGQGLIFDEEGTVTGFDPVFLQNMEKILIFCRKYGVACVPSILPHGYASNYGNGNGNETPKQIWDKYFRFYYEDEAREAFIENGVKPLCRLFADYQDVVPICNLVIENSSSILSDEELGFYFSSSQGSTVEEFRKTVNAMHYAVKEYMPNVLTSTENMGDSELQFICNETDVDLIGQNRYHSECVAGDQQVEYLTKPTYIGEYNGGESGFDQFSQEYWGKIKANMYPSAKSLGYIGAFYFSYCSGGDPFNLFDGLSTDYDSMRSYAMTLSYQIDEMIKEHRNDKTALYTPSLLYNKGSKDVYWMPGKGVTSFKLERSLDSGKTWKTVVEDLSIDDCSLDSGLCKYTDEGVGEGMTYCYRVTSFDDAGNSAVSIPNNSAKLYIAEELMVNGGFEDGTEIPAGEQATGWYSKLFGDTSDAEANSGSYSLRGDKANGFGSGTWGGTFQNVKVKPNTAYKLTYYIKGYEGKSFVQVWDKAGGSSISGAACWHGKTVPEGETEPTWVKCSITFTTGDYDEIMIAVKYNDSEDGKFFFDDFSLKENR